jgi:hypothetical protein
MNLVDGYYQVDETNCVQNYGFNPVQLTVPVPGTSVTADFQGIKGDAQYNTTYDLFAGWRWGFVGIQSDGTPVYGEMNSNDSGVLSFTVPFNMQLARLYFVVSGAPKQHFHHAWDDTGSNDEQYPWKVKFTNATIL